MLGETSDSDIEIVAVFATYVLDEIDSVDKTTLDCFPFVFSLGRIPAQCEYISAAMLFCVLQQRG